MGKQEAITLVIKLLFVMGGLAALVWFVLRPMVRAWSQQPNPDDLMPKFPDLPEDELQIPVDPSGRPKPNRAQMLKQLREDPRQTAMLLQHAIRQKDKDKVRRGAAKD